MEKKKVCWNITTKCNQNCKYCHRFKEIKELSFEENKQILEKLIKDGITNITWTRRRGSPISEFNSIIKISKIKQHKK